MENDINKIFKINDFYEIVILGAGPASLFLSFLLAKNLLNKGEYKNLNILIIEKEKIIGKKLLISGKGACNFTNISNEETFIKNYPRGKYFFKKIFYKFTNFDFIKLIEENGIKTSVEKNGKCFPLSKNSNEILNLFLSQIKKSNKFTFLTESKPIFIEYINNLKKNFKIEIESKNSKKIITVFSNFLILATGGILENEPPKIKNIDIEISKIAPALYGFETEDNDNIIKKCQGISLKNVSIRIIGTNFKTTGDILFTHKGISGPAILHLSSIAAYYIKDNKFKFKLSINLINTLMKNEKDINSLIKLYKEKLSPIKDKLFKNCYILFNLPSKLFENILILFCKKEKFKIEDPKKIKAKYFLNDLVLKKFLLFICDFRISIINKSNIQSEFVTAGGIELKQIYSNGMYFKNYPQLFAIGEILNIDGLTGGYNLQNCWTTAYVAFKEIEQRIINQNLS
ncbi:MAG: aminoacetone oxidase family FAD-binding enzyme [Spirochaetes bacterium]|nr:aminoacetone oxidase family FAD-binding enzyme [Spirochaetota bacterium]